MQGKMKAAIFVEPGRIVLDDKPIPDVGPLDALIRITTTTICGTDVHILKGEYPVARGLTIGHEPVGVIEKLGSAVQGYGEGQRVIAGAICPSGHSHASLCGFHSQDGAGTRHGLKPLGGWRFGNTIDGCQAEYVLVPDAMANLAPVPDSLTDEEVLMCPDIMSTGFAGAESGGDQDRRHRRGVRPRPDRPVRHGRAPSCGRDDGDRGGHGARAHGDVAPDGRRHFVDFKAGDPVEEIMRLTEGRGVDVAIEALGTQATFEAALSVSCGRAARSPAWVSIRRSHNPAGALCRRLGDHTIVTSLCPGGKERMRRLMDVVASHRVDLRPMVTHRFKLDDIEAAYDLFSNQRDGVLKVAITSTFHEESDGQPAARCRESPRPTAARLHAKSIHTGDGPARNTSSLLAKPWAVGSAPATVCRGH